MADAATASSAREREAPAPSGGAAGASAPPEASGPPAARYVAGSGILAAGDPLDELRPGAVVTAEHLAAIEALRARAAPAWQIRARRLAQRDAAIRRAAHALATPGITITARLLARLMAADARAIDVDLRVREHVADALRLNGGRPLAWRQLVKILDDGDRG